MHLKEPGEGPERRDRGDRPCEGPVWRPGHEPPVWHDAIDQQVSGWLLHDLEGWDDAASIHLPPRHEIAAACAT